MLYFRNREKEQLHEFVRQCGTRRWQFMEDGALGKLP